MKDFFQKYADRMIPEPNSGCLIWTGSWTNAGYGNFTRFNRTHYAHHAAFESSNPNGVPVGQEIRHTCDTRCCVNPAHLTPGTRRENIQDMLDRDRSNPPVGERCALAKLSDADVVAIRAKNPSHKECLNMAPSLGVAGSTLYAALRGYTFKHLAPANNLLCHS